MNEYRIRKGVVLEVICGRYLLIATDDIIEKCGYIRKIEEITAFYWEMMEQGLSIDEMVRRASSLFENIPVEQLRVDIEDMIEQLKTLGYILKDNESE